jgi:hypothetical protein
LGDDECAGHNNRNVQTIKPDQIFNKTPKGKDEVQTRDKAARVRVTTIPIRMVRKMDSICDKYIIRICIYICIMYTQLDEFLQSRAQRIEIAIDGFAERAQRGDVATQRHHFRLRFEMNENSQENDDIVLRMVTEIIKIMTARKRLRE